MDQATQTQTKACAACANWNEKNNNEGECRAHAPQLITFDIDDSVRVESRFPVTSAEDWCGDFEMK